MIRQTFDDFADDAAFLIRGFLVRNAVVLSALSMLAFAAMAR
jgi:hypothetical protein